MIFISYIDWGSQWPSLSATWAYWQDTSLWAQLQVPGGCCSQPLPFKARARAVRHIRPELTGNACVISYSVVTRISWGPLATKSFSCSTWHQPFLSTKSRMIYTEALHWGRIKTGSKGNEWELKWRPRGLPSIIGLEDRGGVQTQAACLQSNWAGWARPQRVTLSDPLGSVSTGYTVSNLSRNVTTP